MNKKRIAIITPVYNEEESLPVYRKTVEEVLLSKKDYEITVILVDDGSTDKSWSLIKNICKENPKFKALRLSRNYGSHIALTAGFDMADADAVATLACDLQDPPEIILQFIEKWEKGAQIVWGKRKTREDKKWRMIASKIFHRLVENYALPKNSKFTTGSFFLIDRKVLECFKQFREHNRITFALVAWTGFEQDTVEYDRKKRLYGKSGWNFAKMIKAMYDTFIGFSTTPVRLITYAGVAVFIISIILSLYVILSWILKETLPGWTGLMLAMSFFFGIQFLLMGIMGEYLYRIYAESLRRPLYFISDKEGFEYEVDEDKNKRPSGH